MRNIPYRICITTVNIFFPPVAVMMLTGLGHDTLINSLLFLAGVIPSHVHGFYISCTYFHRRRKARKGKYPGGRAGMISSKNVLNGGLSSAEVDRRWWAENGGTKTTSSSTQKRRSGSSAKNEKRRSKRNSRRTSWTDAETQINPGQQITDMSLNRPQTQRIQTWRSDVPPPGYGHELSPALPPRPGVG